MHARWIDAIGDALAEKAQEVQRQVRAEFREQLHALELKIAGLEGELNMLRGMRSETTKIWRP